MAIVVPRLVLVTTRVVYYRLDFPSLLNEFTWQADDVVPELPRVQRFLEHWRREVRATIACIEWASSESRDWRSVDWLS